MSFLNVEKLTCIFRYVFFFARLPKPTKKSALELFLKQLHYHSSHQIIMGSFSKSIFLATIYKHEEKK